MSTSPRRTHDVPIENYPAFRNIITQDPKLRFELSRARRFARSGDTILIEGKTGTGKELIAQAIHAGSPRAQGPFLPLNMGCFTEDLADSELFGHRRGAFTGATEDQIGLFEAAESGTVFLDEISEAGLNVQKKLLRVLAEKKIRRVGERTFCQLDCTILCATNRDLAQEAAAGRFREDLFQRISALVVHVPPLRERPGDILPLAEHFLLAFAAQFDSPVVRFEPGTLDCLRAYPFPGNVRELENAIKAGVLIETEESLRVESLPAKFFEAMAPFGPKYLRLADRIAQVRELLEVCRGDTETALRRSGLRRSRFYQIRRGILAEQRIAAPPGPESGADSDPSE